MVAKLFLYLAIFAIGFVGVSLWSFWLIIRPPKIIINSIPRDYGLEAEDLTLKTKDGLKLSAWLIPKREIGNEKLEAGKNRALILMHGYPAEKADLLSLAKSLTSDFSLLLFDMRYFGESEGKYTTLGKKETLDLEVALDFLKNRGYYKTGVFGFSLGGSVAIMQAAEDKRIAAVAAYAPFANLKLLGYSAYKDLRILKYLLVELLSLWAKIFLDYDANSYSPETTAKTLRIPVLLIHSKEDEQISFLHAERLKKSLSQNPNAEFYFIEKGLHGDLPPDFDQHLLEFFQKSLQ